jgi:glycosyltransferase involved in cell wall biosynthesis
MAVSEDGSSRPEMTPPVLSVVVPFYNEGDNVDSLFARLVPVLEEIGEPWEIVCVNDGSSDGTLGRLLARRAVEPRIAIVDFSRNFGKECALSAGLGQSRGRAVVVLDADLQHPPEAIPALLAKWHEGYEMVYAMRHARTGQGRLYRLAARLFYAVMGRVSDVALPAEVGDFRLLDRRVVDVINAMPERSRFMKGIFSWVGFRQIGVVYRQEARCRGTSKWRFLPLLRFAIDGLTAFSTFPLTVWGLIGAAVSGVSFLYILVRLIRVAFLGIDVPGYESLIVAILFLGGVQLISLGVLGSYLGRVFEEVKQRPLYIVRQVYAGPAAASEVAPSPQTEAGPLRKTS